MTAQAPAIPTATAGIPLTRAVPWLVGGASGVAAWSLHQSPTGALFTALCCLVLAQVSIVDLRERRIPNMYTYTATPLALLAALLHDGAFMQALLGAGASMLAMGLCYLVSRGRLGLGDVKLGGFTGAILGLPVVPAFLLVSSLLGAAAAIVLLVRTRDPRTLFAYGPYMAIAAAVLLIMHGPAGAKP